MINIFDNCYVLETKNTTYAMRVLKSGHIEHLYYGPHITIREEKDAEALIGKCVFNPGNTLIYDDENPISLENMCLEISSNGKGDLREPFVEIIHSDGSRTSDFLFESVKILDEKPVYETLPTAYDDGTKTSAPLQTLEIVLRDKNYNIRLITYFTVFYDTDVITRQNILINDSDENIRVSRLMSMQLDLDRDDFIFTTFNGAWAREMGRNDIKVRSGKHINSSMTGTSSNRANPFVMISRDSTNESKGGCYGFNLVYSGNHYECMEVNSFRQSRLVCGINPETFEYILGKGEKLEAPEAVMTFSLGGYGGMSLNMHEFVREHIVRGTHKYKDRPILLNSWEACYFNINERKLLNLAKKGAEVGIELFVMDDGWFGERSDDTKALGDWDPDLNKLPGGLKGIANKVNALGLQFGIWVEPEMVNENSNLYKKHPEWTMSIPGKGHSKGRNQMLLDLTNEHVQNFIINKMTEVFSSANIAYVKWDMNRIASDFFSQSMGAMGQGEMPHRYVLGLYRVMKELTERFPDILFEGCASGGNRFDLGILCYFPQIWASDNTDAISRGTIQTGYSYGYPMSVIGAHVSGSPNHQTLRRTPLETRFNVASFGILGYECNLCDATADELSAIKEQIALYKKLRPMMQWGSFYRGRCFNSETEPELLEWTVVSKDKKTAVSLLLQRMVTPNMPMRKIFIRGLLPDVRYTLTNRELKYSIKEFGDLVNTVSPIHIKQNSAALSAIDKVYKMNGEKECITGYGDTFMSFGVNLKQGFIGTGYNEEVAHFQDYGSRLYLIDSAE